MGRRTIPLTDADCRQAKYSADGIGNKRFDGEGLYLELMPSGSKKWRLKYRINGRENRLTLGDYPTVTLAAARDRRMTVRRQLADGIDPALQREIDRQTSATAAASTFQAIAADWLAIKRRGWSASHDKRMTAILVKDIYPQIGKRPIATLTGPTVLATIRKIEQRGAHEIAAKALEACGGVCRYACAVGVSINDPTAGLRDHLAPKPPVQHYARVSEDELPTLLERVDGYSGTPETKLAIKLMILTFVRTNEFRWAKWEEFDFNTKEWRIPSERMKGKLEQKATGVPHIVPLSRQAVALLDELRELTGRHALLFPGVRNPATQPISAETINKALKSLGFEGKQTGHGFRGLASTIMNERSGFHPDAIERQLAHSVGNKIRRAYNHAQHLEERRALMQWWGDYIDQKSGGNVVPLRSSAIA